MTRFVYRQATPEEQATHRLGVVIEVDGIDVTASVTGVEFGHYSSSRGGMPAAVTLNLMPGETSLSTPDADVEIDQTTRRLLVRLGWTPPKEGTK